MAEVNKPNLTKELRIEDIPQKYIDEVLSGGYSDCEIGYKRLDNGMDMLCHYAFYPNCTPEMFVWWLSNAMCTHETMYKFWHPAHVYNEWSKERYSARYPGEENVIGYQYHEEWFGGMLAKGFHRILKAENLFDMSKKHESVKQVLVLSADTLEEPHYLTAILFFALRETFFGCEMRLRQFMLPDPDLLPDPNNSNSFLDCLVGHGIYEYNEMAEWLPGFYNRSHYEPAKRGFLWEDQLKAWEESNKNKE